MAIDYSQYIQNVKDPLQSVLQGYQAGTAITQQRQQSELLKAKKAQIDAAKARQEALQADITKIGSKGDITAQDYSKLMLDYPELSEEFERSFKTLSEGQQEQQKQDAITIMTAAELGDTDAIMNLLDERIEGYKQSGDNENMIVAQSMRNMLKIPMADYDPNNIAKVTSALQLNAMLGDKDFADVWDKVQARTAAMKEVPEGFELLPPDEARKSGLTDGVYQRSTKTGKISKAGDTKEEKSGDPLFRVLETKEIKQKGLPDGAYQIDEEGRIYPIGQAQTKISVSMGGEGYKVGSGVPAGYALKEINGEPVLVALKGGPVAMKTEEDKKKDLLQAEQTGTAANVVKDDIKRLTNLIERQKWYNPVTGILGKAFEGLPATARTDASALQTTISANIGFDRLQQMRDASKTGGALGAISEREMTQLSSVLGSLDLNQSDEQLLDNLERLDRLYTDIIKKANVYPNAGEFGFGNGKATLVNMPSHPDSSGAMPQNIKDRYMK